MKSKNKASIKVIEIDMMRIDPGAIGFTSGFSQDSISITVGEQITVEQLIEKRKVMTISKAMIMNIGITSASSTPK